MFEYHGDFGQLFFIYLNATMASDFDIKSAIFCHLLYQALKVKAADYRAFAKFFYDKQIKNN